MDRDFQEGAVWSVVIFKMGDHRGHLRHPGFILRLLQTVYDTIGSSKLREWKWCVDAGEMRRGRSAERTPFVLYPLPSCFFAIPQLLRSRSTIGQILLAEITRRIPIGRWERRGRIQRLTSAHPATQFR